VPDVRRSLIEAHEPVERVRLSDEDFRAFAFGNAVRLWAGSNPRFFAGTAVERAVAAELEASARSASSSPAARSRHAAQQPL
jgi:hypothetical protein